METTKAITKVESQTITLSERCKRLDCYSPFAIKKHFATVNTMTDCIRVQKEQGEPSLKAISLQHEQLDKKLKAMIALNTAALNAFLHLNNPLTDEENEFIAEEIIDEFGDCLTMADVYIIIKNAKKGLYGKLYERLSAPDVLSWFRDYYEKRMEAAYEYNINHDKTKYGVGVKQEDMLKTMGYTIDKETGRTVIDHDVINANNARREERAKKDPRRIDEVYQKIKADLFMEKMKMDKEEITTEPEFDKSDEVFDDEPEQESIWQEHGFNSSEEFYLM